VEVNATFPGAFHHLSSAIAVSFSVYPLSAVLQYIIHIHRPFFSQGPFTSHIHIFLSLPQFLASIVIFTNWGKQGVTHFILDNILFLTTYVLTKCYLGQFILLTVLYFGQPYVFYATCFAQIYIMVKFDKFK
jgi:hypothetical protein